jgi:antitoxin ParD1/3/4
MSISLTSDQESFIEAKLQTEKYNSPQEVLEIALRLLEAYDRAEAKWLEEVGTKIDAAIEVSDRTPPIDGKTFIDNILERFQSKDRE